MEPKRRPSWIKRKFGDSKRKTHAEKELRDLTDEIYKIIAKLQEMEQRDPPDE